MDIDACAIGYREGTIPPDQRREFEKEIFRVISRLSGTVAYRLNFSSKEDLAQELSYLFYDVIIKRYTPGMSLASYIFEYGLRTCRHMKGELPKHSLFQEVFSNVSDDGTMSDSIDLAMGGYSLDIEGIEATSEGTDLLGKSIFDVDTLKKLPIVSRHMHTDDIKEASLMQDLRAFGFGFDVKEEDYIEAVKLLVESASFVNDEKPLGKKAKCLTADQIELRGIRIKMNKTKKEFCQEIGIGVSTLDAYEYGVTKSVPSDVMANARALQLNFTDELSEVREFFNGWPMSRIIEHWGSMLDMDITNFKTLALFFGVSKTTIKRWMANVSMPSIDRIAFWDDYVKKLAALKSAT